MLDGEVEGADEAEARASCGSGCVYPPALVIEQDRLRTIGGRFLGICGDTAHGYGYHLPASSLPSSDYSLKGKKNKPVCKTYASAIDIGMNWKRSRAWLRWLIREKREGRMPNIAEVIGSYDGKYVMYWSDTDTPKWPKMGIDYYKEKKGKGHDSWTHVAIYRSTAKKDPGILLGWPSQYCGGKSCSNDQFCLGNNRCCPTDKCVPGCPCRD